MKVKYLGPLKDYSGYGEANRHFVAALDAAGVFVIPELVTYSIEASDFGTVGRLIEPFYERQDSDYRIKILHTTPNVFKRHVEPGKYNIAHFFWETDLVPEDFAAGLKLCDEIWTGSEVNRKAIKKAGVDKPVYVFPQPIETDRLWPNPYEIKDFDGYLFYSIFEWTDRKNPQALLKAYWQEFNKGENVGLLIKTYFSNFSLLNKRMIRHQIEQLKREFSQENYPPVYLYLHLMDRDQIMRLHKTGDCYVSAHRGEGWGVPQAEAALSGHPIISTDFCGLHEYFEDGETMLKVPYKLQKVRGMTHSELWYNSKQNWADVDVDELRKKMRFCYENQEKATEIGKNAERFVKKSFNFEQVGSQMLKRLKEIEATL